jgi:MFS family permease
MATMEERGALFESLRYPGAKSYFAGLLASMAGTWMQSVALSWLVIKVLHGSGKELGYLGIAQFLPMLVLGSWAGALSDRLDKRRVMLVTQTILATAAATLGILTISHHVTLVRLLMISALAGLANAFDTPVRRAMVGDLVPKAVVPNAMSLNTSVITSSRFFGMMIGGFFTKWFGPGPCFLINAASYLAMIAAIASLRIRQHATLATENGGVWHAFRHIVKTPVLLIAMSATAVVATITFNYTLTYPLMIDRVFHADAGVLGIVMAVSSIGSFVGSLLSARRRSPSLLVFLSSCMVMGFSGLAVGFAPSLFWLTAFSMPLAGGGGLLMAQLSGLLTSLSPSVMRGRVLAFQSVVFIGSTPIGGPIVGYIADSHGARWGMASGGIAALIAGAVGFTWMSASIGRHRPTLAARRG